MNIQEIGKVCKEFRVNILELSLTNFSKQNNVNLQNIHAFENGRANNIKYIYMYINSCKNETELDILLESLFKAI